MKTVTFSIEVPAAFASLLERVAKAEKQSSDAWVKSWLIQGLDADLQCDEVMASRLGFPRNQLKNCCFEWKLRELAGLPA